jgi:hypothetical protein
MKCRFVDIDHHPSASGSRESALDRTTQLARTSRYHDNPAPWRAHLIPRKRKCAALSNAG